VKPNADRDVRISIRYIVHPMIRTAEVFACLSWCLTTPVIGQGAAMSRGNLAHTGVYDAPGVPVFHKVKWQFHTDGLVISSPAVVNGVAYFGSTDHNLYAVDIASGALKWRSPRRRESHPRRPSRAIWSISRVTTAISTQSPRSPAR
jgi:hypothetical protein